MKKNSKDNNKKNGAKLKRCPFCGSESFVHEWNKNPRWSIECKNAICCAYYGFENRFYSKRNALKFWNTRYNETKDTKSNR